MTRMKSAAMALTAVLCAATMTGAAEARNFGGGGGMHTVTGAITMAGMDRASAPASTPPTIHPTTTMTTAIVSTATIAGGTSAIDRSRIQVKWTK
jgi:hypothetical protein